MNKGVYVHVPFCVQKCPYCDFYSSPSNEGERLLYADRVINAIDKAPFDFSADTLYIGGGTPTTLPADALCRILEAAKRRFGLINAECTVEANPGTVTRDDLRRLVDGGFNRISFGVQSTDDKLLKTLGRIHSFKEAAGAITWAHEAGFRHISADLMLCVPGQTVESIELEVNTLAQLPIDHLSAYLLQIEEGTRFFDTVAEPDEDFYADCYRKMVDAALKNGFSRYEISNFARDEEARSRHNLHYWRCEEYLGIGPSAHSFMEGRRFFTKADRAAFINASDPWALTVEDGAGGSEEERIMLGLRLAEGIAPSEFSPETEKRLRNAARELIAAGLIKAEGDRIALTTEGFLLSNAVTARLI